MAHVEAQASKDPDLQFPPVSSCGEDIPTRATRALHFTARKNEAKRTCDAVSPITPNMSHNGSTSENTFAAKERGQF